MIWSTGVDPGFVLQEQPLTKRRLELDSIFAFTEKGDTGNNRIALFLFYNNSGTGIN
jgi:hypothetical protein